MSNARSSSVPISAQICSEALVYSDVLVMLYSIFIKNILACTCLHLYQFI